MKEYKECGCCSQEDEVKHVHECCEHDEHEHCGCTCGCGHEEHIHEHHEHSGCSCGCGHDHEHGGGVDREEVAALGAALILFFCGLLLPVPDVLRLIFYLGAYLIPGWKVLLQAAKNIVRGHIFNEIFLMAVASLGACLIGEISEGAAVMIFYNIGELLQSYAVGQSRKSITALMDIRPDTANLLEGSGTLCVPAEQVEIGQVILVRAGERIPLDGIVLEGKSQLDMAALTGESLPRDIHVGDTVLAGCINLTGPLSVRVSKSFENSTASKILELTEHASQNKAQTERFISRFAKYYTPVVVFAAVATAVLPPLLGFGTFKDYLYRALTFLVLSCPCALVISVPMGFFAGIGRCSKEGILVKGGNYLEALNDAEIIAFDKTGTLTKGELTVTEIHSVGISKEELLETAALAEAQSTHPIAVSLRKEYGTPLDLSRVGTVTELAGNGIKAEVDGREVLIGNRRLMETEKISVPDVEGLGTLVYLTVDGVYRGWLLIGDRVKETAGTALKRLKALGVHKTVMLTGDRRMIGEAIAKYLYVDEVCAELLPEDKLRELERLMAEKQRKEGKILFVGDGMNDAPVLARADVGVAMGGIGSDAAIEAADVVIMDDDVTQVAKAISIARYTKKIVAENIIFALCVKLIILTLSFVGYSSMWAAVFADVGVCILTVLNAMRIFLEKTHN